jgi:hypothetical protein
MFERTRLMLVPGLSVAVQLWCQCQINLFRVVGHALPSDYAILVIAYHHHAVVRVQFNSEKLLHTGLFRVIRI